MTKTSYFIDVITNDYGQYIKKQSKERIQTFDFIRGLAVFFMVIVHVLMTYGTDDVNSSFFGGVIDFFGGPPAAPVFMFSMGVFFILSTRSSNLKASVKRGITLLLLGYLLSFLRTDLLLLIENYLTQKHLTSVQLFTLWEVDILIFAGWAYILMSIIRFYFKKPIWWLFIAIMVLIASPFLWGISSDIKIVDWIFNFLWGNREEVYFPIFGWLFYPLIGMTLGVLMKASSDIETLFKSLLKVGLSLLFVGSIITATNFDFHIGDYYRSGPGSMIWIMGFVFIWLWLCHKTINKIRDIRLFNIIYYWGKNTPLVYFIHWLLISWGTILLGYEAYGYLGTALLMGLFLIATHLSTKVIKAIT
ncbi:acyltransferase family protein [Vallitalea okinawensis]|uniref:acyltransferase family protein n=1 Tax=Vallitalea okinawensis TaxID=2078660 RepID=UPI000CFC4176|nr:acyltransferase family protein [Vallitalea okinawensis]